MKKAVIILSAAVLLLALGLGMMVFDMLFPKAKPADIPSAEEIISVSVSVHNAEKEMEKEDFEKLLSKIEEAKPTRIQSVNDYPSVEPFFTAEIKTEDINHRFFIYEEDGKIYIEKPYEGIWLSDEEMFNFILKYFEE